MEQFEGDHGSLQAQAHVWNHVYNFINSMSLKCAVELCIPDAIHKHGGKPVTLSQLVSALGILPNKAADLGRLMRLLTHSGFFTVQTTGDGEEAYLLTSYSKHLLSDNPHTVSHYVRAILDPMLLMPWQSLSAWFRVGSHTPFHHSHGTNFWNVMKQSSELNRMFNEGMAGDSHLMMDVVAKEHGEVFRGLKSLVDVGGGNGATAMTLAKAFPQMKCTVLELPHVVATAPESTAVVFTEGDMFKCVPPADAILLKWILHNWSDEHCVKLLKLCKEAIPPKEEGGKLIILDMVVREDLILRHELRETQYFFDMLMMVETEGGKERSEEEWVRLLNSAGFSEYKIIPGLGFRAIIEVYP